ANRRQLQTLHWTIVRALENARVFKSQCGGIFLGHRRRQLHSNSRILGTALRSQRLARGIEHLGHPQPVMELKGGDVEIFQRSELYLGTRCYLVNMGKEF